MDATDSSSGYSSEQEASPVPGNGVLRSATSTAATATYDYTYNEFVDIASQGVTEAVTINANVFIPVAKTEGETFPAIIFGNSWGLEEHEYTAQAIYFAKKGYVVLSFQNRGWYTANGEINLGGLDDRADFKAVVDWLIANTPVDSANIGVCGISLGGGTALNAMAHDSRIKTVVGISAWTDLGRHMWSEDTPRAVWGLIIVGSGMLLGNISDDITAIWNATLTNTNIPWLKEWCALRSPITFVEEINKKNRPIYIANAMEDYLFMPDTVLDFFNALTVDHKRVDLSLGTHFTPEATGIIGLDNYVFTNVRNWFDYWLKGIDTGIISDQGGTAVVTMQLKNSLARVEYNAASLKKSDGEYTWPPSSVSSQTFYCGPRTLITNGSLKTTVNTKATTNDFYSGLLSGASAGTLLFPLLEQLGVAVTTNVNLLNRIESITWESPAFTTVKKIRGGAEAKLRLSLNKKAGQVIIYLYDVDKWGTATFITHGFHTFWNATPGQVMDVTVPIISTAYNIPSGHHLAMVIDSSDPLYAKPTLDPFKVNFHYGVSSAEQITLKVPFEN